MASSLIDLERAVDQALENDLDTDALVRIEVLAGLVGKSDIKINEQHLSDVVRHAAKRATLTGLDAVVYSFQAASENFAAEDMPADSVAKTVWDRISAEPAVAPAIITILRPNPDFRGGFGFNALPRKGAEEEFIGWVSIVARPQVHNPIGKSDVRIEEQPLDQMVQDAVLRATVTGEDAVVYTFETENETFAEEDVGQDPFAKAVWDRILIESAVKPALIAHRIALLGFGFASSKPPIEQFAGRCSIVARIK